MTFEHCATTIGIIAGLLATYYTSMLLSYFLRYIVIRPLDGWIARILRLFCPYSKNLEAISSIS